MTQEEFKIEIDKLKQSPWFDDGKTIDYSKTVTVVDIDHIRYLARKEAIETVCDLFKGDMTPTGHWVKDSDIDYGCSACGRRQLWMNATVYDYCPHCGAKMDESEGE